MSAQNQYRLCPKCRSIYPSSAKICGNDRAELELSEDVVAGRYVKMRKLGQGGMGTVWEAWEPRLKRRVALKVLNIDKDRLKYYEREVEALGRLTDDHIVTVYERGQEEPYIAMEILDGMSLDDYLEKHGPIPLRRAFRLWRQAVRGIMVAHKAGIVHRDIKPANLFLTKKLDEAGEPVDLVKILDFGIATVEERGEKSPQQRASQTQRIGTLYFVAPEQWRGMGSAASDVYSLGVVLLAMLTGDRIFRNPRVDIDRVFERLKSSSELRRLAQEVLDADPAKRPANAEVLLQRISTLPELRRPSLGWSDNVLELPETDAPPKRLGGAGTSPRSTADQVAEGKPKPDSRIVEGSLPPLSEKQRLNLAKQQSAFVDPSSILEPADSDDETEQMRATRLPLPTPSKVQSVSFEETEPRGSADSEQGPSTDPEQGPSTDPEKESTTSHAEEADKLKNKIDLAFKSNMAPEPDLGPKTAVLNRAPFVPLPPKSRLQQLFIDLQNRSFFDPRNRPLLVAAGVLLVGLVLLVTMLLSAPSEPSVVAPNPASGKDTEHIGNAGAFLDAGLVDAVLNQEVTDMLPSAPDLQTPSAKKNYINVRFVYCHAVEFRCGKRQVDAKPKKSGRIWYEVKMRRSDVCTATQGGMTETFTYTDVQRNNQADDEGWYPVLQNINSDFCK